MERSVFADVAESYLGPGENTRISSCGTKTTNSVVEGLNEQVTNVPAIAV